MQTSTLALQNGHNAYGAKYIKKGFCFTPEMDLAFALGYPHYIELVDNHPVDKDPLGKGLEFAMEVIFWQAHLEKYTYIWPRGIASRAARSFPFLSHRTDKSKILEMFSEDKPINEREIKEVIAKWLRCNHGEIFLLLLEALAGSDIIGELTIDALERFTEENWLSSSFINQTYYLGFLLLRMSHDASLKVRERLIALYQKGRWNCTAMDYIDCVLNGAEGAERSGRKFYDDKGNEHIARIFTTQVFDDPQWVTKTIINGNSPWPLMCSDPRSCFLGTEELLKVECSWWKKYKFAGAHAMFIERFGHIKSEILLPTFLEMAEKSQAKKKAKEWFINHKDFTVDFLQQEAKSNNKAAIAILKQMEK